VQAEVSAIRDALLKRHATYIDTSEKPVASFEALVAQVYKEITGKEFPKKRRSKMRGASTIVSTESAMRNERRPLVGRGSGLIEGAPGPQPHRDFIEVFGETALR